MHSPSIHDTTGTSNVLDQGELRAFEYQGPSGPLQRHYWPGQPWQLGSAAYWEQMAAAAQVPTTYRLGETLLEEVGACLLGGYGIPADTAAAAFTRLRGAGVFHSPARWSSASIEALLRAPFTEFLNSRRYRFPQQRARRLEVAMQAIRTGAPPSKPLRLREWLQAIPGIGPKTASWIVRNQTASNEVAIVDIHIIRAGTAAGVFDPEWRVGRDYDTYERAFLCWADHAGLAASILDATVWGVLSSAGADARDILGTTQVSKMPKAVWPIDERCPTS